MHLFATANLASVVQTVVQIALLVLLARFLKALNTASLVRLASTARWRASRLRWLVERAMLVSRWTCQRVRASRRARRGRSLTQARTCVLRAMQATSLWRAGPPALLRSRDIGSVRRTTLRWRVKPVPSLRLRATSTVWIAALACLQNWRQLCARRAHQTVTAFRRLLTLWTV